MRSELICLFTAFLITLSVSAQDVVLEKVENGHRIEVFALNNSSVDQEVTLDLTLEYVAVDKGLPVVMVIPAKGRVKMATLTPEPLKPWSYKTRYNFRQHIVEEVKPEPVATRPEPEVPASTQPSGDQRTFEEGPDIADQEGYDVPPAQMPGQQAETTDIEAGESTIDLPPPAPKVPLPAREQAADNGVMGPPLSTDDMPIPARYYEPPVSPSASTDDANIFEIPAESVVTIGMPDKVVVYGQPGCPRCAMAKEFLAGQNVPFEYFDITTDQEAKDEMTARLFDSGFTGGQFIMPVVYVDNIAHYSIRELDVFLESLASED